MRLTNKNKKKRRRKLWGRGSNIICIRDGVRKDGNFITTTSENN